ncbi:uncharacterized protein LOC117342928 [Pecten maximus]|uniref:uncharacterized protein LOC117342928 n=1 Tax=Pecten maximus TaxID=6579 RepID=UPI001458E5C8|nr:uncharacterized protein LOC117342928 [Pecten maximus]XP_033761121.1 uncharacterized protein LOC117342928 [Pecten maximus]
MAEGGPPHEKKGNDNNTELCACPHLECPICLEQMREPKSLPCLHSFCEECLGTYIVTDMSGEMAAATSFPCPVCRKITSPVDPSESKETWARQFPVNSLVHSKVMSDTQLYCGYCKRTKNIETQAKHMCKQNGMLFCDFCKTNAHDFFHEVCDIISIEGMAWKQPLSKACSKHKEQIDWYCKDHKFIGCNRCIITAHRRCITVMTTKEYCAMQRDNSSLDDMDKSLGKAFNCMELMDKACGDQEESLQQDQDLGLKSISDLRQKINNHLDKKQEEITEDLISKYKAEKAKVDVSRQKCSRLRAAIQNTREASRTAARIDDNIEMIQLLHRGQTEIGACNDLIDDISSKSVSVKHNVDPSLVTIDQTSPLTLGTILVEEDPCTIPDGVEYVQNHTMLSNSRVRKLRKYTIKVPSDKKNCNARGVLLMANGNMVISDFQNLHIKLFSFEGQCLNVLTTDGFPRDLCLVDDNTLAVAVSSYNAGIHVVKVQDSVLTLSKVIKVPGIENYYGIVFLDGKFTVSTPNDVYRVTMEGKTEKVDTFPESCCHLSCSPDRKVTLASLVVSNADEIAVFKLSSDVHKCVLRLGLVNGAMGIDIDREGNLYVCGQGSNNIVQLSVYGTRIRELLTSKDGINKPRAISVYGDKFVVTNQSARNCNDIHVYQFY